METKFRDVSLSQKGRGGANMTKSGSTVVTLDSK